jgi:hypothetical protein
LFNNDKGKHSFNYFFKSIIICYFKKIKIKGGKLSGTDLNFITDFKDSSEVVDESILNENFLDETAVIESNYF